MRAGASGGAPRHNVLQVSTRVRCKAEAAGFGLGLGFAVLGFGFLWFPWLLGGGVVAVGFEVITAFGVWDKIWWLSVFTGFCG